MKKLVESVQNIIQEEYDRAAVKFGAANNSHHESYAVILEEFEEAIQEQSNFSIDFRLFWNFIKSNNNDEIQKILPVIKNHAKNAVAEWVQVAAMCHKAMQNKIGDQKG